MPNLVFKKQISMKLLIPILLATALMSLLACGSDKTKDASAAETQDTVTTRGMDAPPPLTHNCDIAGEMLEGNQFWARDAEVLVTIVADSTTYDADLQAASHRILEVYDTRNCSRILRQTLPVDRSPDFPYYIAEITYNNLNKIVAIKGTTGIYCYDVNERKLLPRLKPGFRSERFDVDAQSGQIQRLEVWEDYLIGYAQDYGVFAFDLSDRQAPKTVLPFAEYAMDEVSYAPLFLLSADAGGVQAIMPEYNRETGEFPIHPAFDAPMKLNTNVQRSATNNRYLVLREEGTNKAMAFDLQAHRRVNLPADVATKNTQEILNWMRSNVQ